MMGCDTKMTVGIIIIIIILILLILLILLLILIILIILIILVHPSVHPSTYLQIANLGPTPFVDKPISCQVNYIYISKNA